MVPTDKCGMLLTFTLLILCIASPSIGARKQGRHSKVLKQVFDDYDVNEWPAYQRNEPTKVSVQMFLNSFGSLNAADMDFDIDVFLRQRWHDPRLRFNASKENLVIKDPDVQDRIWKPDTFFINVKKAHIHAVTMPNVLMRINTQGEVLYSIRVTATLSCHLELQQYPFDSQICSTILESYGSTDDIIHYEWHENAVDHNNDISIAQFDLMDYESEASVRKLSTGNFSSLKVKFHLKRQNGYHILQTYIPTILIVMISWVSFWLDPTAVPGRVSLGVTTLLTLTTLAAGIRQNLPPVSYVKAIDVWIGMCMIMVFGALLEFTLVNWLANKKILRERRQSIFKISKTDDAENDERGGNSSGADENESADEEADVKPITYMPQAKTMDHFARAAFPLSFLIFNIVYWPYYQQSTILE